MCMTSRIMLDSSILVEYIKQNATELLDWLAKNDKYELCINSTVLSECAFHWIALYGDKAPRTLQQSRRIPAILTSQPPVGFLNQFTVLPSDDRIVPIYLNLMQQYNLLPNDALIIATAKLHHIPAVASFDADFEPACAGEQIQLVREVGDLT